MCSMLKRRTSQFFSYCACVDSLPFLFFLLVAILASTSKKNKKTFISSVVTQDACDQYQTGFIRYTDKCFHQGYFYCKISYVLAWHTMCFIENSKIGSEWVRDLARSRDKLKLLYLHYHNVYDYQTWHLVAHLDRWRALTFKVTSPFNHMSCEIKWQIKNISPLPHCLWPPNLTEWWIAMSMRSYRSKVTWDIQWDYVPN